MSSEKKFLRFAIVIATVLLGAVTSAVIQVFVFPEDEPLYQSVSKLAVRSPILPAVSEAVKQSQTEDYYGMIIETIESAEMKRRAMTKTHISNPKQPFCAVTIDVSRPQNSPVFTISARGKLPAFVPVFLDAFLDEFIAYRSAEEPSSSESTATIVQERASPAVIILGDWEETAFSGAAMGGLAGLCAGLLLAFTFVRAWKESPEQTLNPPSAQSAVTEPKGAIAQGRRMVAWGLAAGIVLGLLIQLMRLSSTPQSFLSLAKVVAAQGLDPGKIASHQVNDDYYGTIIETLESSRIKAAAMKRIKALAPEFTERDVAVSVRQTKGSAIFNILATGGEPKYTRIFLDALLDEFMILRTRQAEEAGLDPRKDVAVQERAIPAMEEIDDWGMPLFVGALTGAGLGGLLGLLSMLFFRRPRELPHQPDPVT